MDGWQQKVRRGEFVGPRIYHTHLPITVAGSHPIPLAKALIGAPLAWFVGWVVPTVEGPGEADGGGGRGG
ncbi:MAG: hypothetical protein H6705_17380 [Myxococcales bacterium]|nr:hypothetical protein [Myxococcales bacterium]